MKIFSRTFHTLLLSSILALSPLLGAPPVMASIFGKSELSGAWKERFQDTNKLNEYTKKGIKVEINDAIIKEYRFNDANFNNASFKNVEWSNTVTKNLTFTNTVIQSNSFENVEFTDAIFNNVTFEDSEFFNTSFYMSQMTGVKFIRCTFKNKSDFSTLKNSNIEFDHSTFEETSFGYSQANFAFHNSILTDVRFVSLAFPSSITFENSKLQDVALDRAKISKLTMDNTTGGGRSGFNGGSIAEVEVKNSAMGFTLSEGNLGKVTFVNSEINVNFASSNIKEIQITNCKKMSDFVLYKSKVDSLQISNCPIDDFHPVEAIIKNFNIDHASIVNSKFKKMKVENFTLSDVSLDGPLDFSNAQVEHLITKNITKLPGLNLNLTGSNVKF